MKYPKNLVLIGTLVTLWFFSAGSVIAETQFIEGKHYQVLREAQAVQSGDKIEVVEMFWYECPHCYKLEPVINRWLRNKPENVEFVTTPAIFSKRWKFSARIYYTLEALGLTEKLHAAVFDTIHREQKNLHTLKQFADWAVPHGIDREVLLETASSFAVESKLNFAMIMSRKYGITGVPAIIVDGKYSTSVSEAGDHEKLFEVIEYLVALATKQR